MRVLAMSVLLLMSMRVCEKTGDSGTTAAAASGSPRASAVARAEISARASLGPRIGGQLVTVGEHVVELVLHARGQVEALVTARAGGKAPDPKAVKLAVVAKGKAGAKPKAELAWSEPRARFVGEVQAGAELAPGPVEVSLEVAGKAAQATAELALAFDPVIGGAVILAGGHSLELVADASGEVEAVLRDAAGAEVKGDSDLEITVKLAARGAAPSVRLAWDTPRARFVGRVEGGVELVPGPVEVHLELGGKVAVGGLAELALRAKAAHGGRVLVAGNHSVELVADADGAIQAFVFDANGKAHAAGDLELSVAVGAHPALELKWDAPSLSYKAKLDGKLDLSAQPIRVSLIAGGRAAVGAIAGLDADARLAAKAGANADVDAKAAADAKLAAGAGAKAKAGAGVNITPPKVNVSVKAPTVKAGAGATAGTKAGTGAKASGKAGFSLGTK